MVAGYGHCAQQVRGGIFLGPARCHGVTENLPAHFTQAACCEDDTLGFDLAKHCQQLRCLDLGNRQMADFWEDIRLQVAEGLVCRDLGPFVRFLGVPFAPQSLETVGMGDLLGPLGFLLRFAGVDTVGKQLPGLSLLLTGARQAHVGISTQGQRLALVQVAVVIAPILAGGIHQQVKPFLIGQLVRLVAGLGLLDRGIG